MPIFSIFVSAGILIGKGNNWSKMVVYTMESVEYGIMAVEVYDFG